MKQINQTDFGRAAKTCHMCKAEDLALILDLGHQPHSDFFPTKNELDEMEPTFPLRLVKCENCNLFQIDYFVNPDYLYKADYLYQSSTTNSGVSHYHAMAQEIVDKFKFDSNELVIDVGSNVGVLLQGFKNLGMQVLGVDPAEVARKSADIGIETIIDYFTHDVAKDISLKHGKASVITGTNVFAHMHDLDDAVLGVKELLSEKGVFVVEAPWALDLLEKVEYDTIYHQHIGYLSVAPMKSYFERYDLELFAVSKSDIHGGTLRYYVGHTGAHQVESSVADIIQTEVESGMYTEEYLQQFQGRVLEQKEALIELLLKLKREGKRVAAISTPAKGNTLLNYCNLDTDMVSFATEKNPLKIGRHTPGMHIPIYDDEEIIKQKVDYALILAWNFSDEIMANMLEFKESGGKFIIPIPYPKVV